MAPCGPGCARCAFPGLTNASLTAPQNNGRNQKGAQPRHGHALRSQRAGRQGRRRTAGAEGWSWVCYCQSGSGSHGMHVFRRLFPRHASECRRAVSLSRQQTRPKLRARGRSNAAWSTPQEIDLRVGASFTRFQTLLLQVRAPRPGGRCPGALAPQTPALKPNPRPHP